MARASAAVPWRARPVEHAFGRALGVGKRGWIRSLATKLTWEPRPAHRALMRAIIDDPRFRIGHGRGDLHGKPPHRTPPIEVATLAELADFLELERAALLWFADVRAMNPAASDAQLHHYRCRWVEKRHGVRLIEAPKLTLKRAQRTLLERVLERMPPDEAAMGFVPGRGVLRHAAAHVGREVVIRMDLRDFFWSVGFARVRGVFRATGFDRGAASTLAGLTVTSTPATVLRRMPDVLAPDERARLRQALTSSHLPQGAPTSPWLANLCAARLDRRLRGLAKAFGGAYTRYADDLAFSGGRELSRKVERFLPRAAAIVLEEGFTPNYRKTRVMRASRRQELCGVIVNRKLAVRRDTVDRLESILINAARNGLESQNRKGHHDFLDHLRGRVAWVEQVAPARGAELRRHLAAIAVPAAS